MLNWASQHHKIDTTDMDINKTVDNLFILFVRYKVHHLTWRARSTTGKSCYIILSPCFPLSGQIV
jgi:hypothetical protein